MWHLLSIPCFKMDKPSKHNAYSSVLAIVAGLIAVFFVFKTGLWPIIAALSISAISAIIPAVARWIHSGWFYLGKVLGMVVSPIVLAVVFFLFLTPVAWLKKVFTHKPPQNNSTFRDSLKDYTVKELENPW